MPVRVGDTRRDGPTLQGTQGVYEPFQFPDNLAELSPSQRDELYDRYQRHNAGMLGAEQDVAISPSRVITSEQAELLRAEREAARISREEEINSPVSANSSRETGGSLPSLRYVEGQGYVDDGGNTDSPREVKRDEAELLLYRKELDSMSAAERDAEIRFGGL